MSIALNIEGPSQSPSSRASWRTDAWLQSLVTESMAKDSNQVTEPKVPRVPPEFREMKENTDCYEPLVVSIGPYHHGKENLEEMEELKAKMAGQFVSYSIEAAEEMYSKVKELVSDARKCYAEESTRQFDDEKFTQMMFLDGYFIVQVVFKLFKQLETQKLRKEQVTSVIRDLFLLENQLPFLVLIPLMRIYTSSGHHSAEEQTSSSKQSWSSERIDQEVLKTVEDFFKTVHEIPLHRESCWEKISIFLKKLPRALLLCLIKSKDTNYALDFYDHLLDFFYFKFVYGEGQHQRERISNREITSRNRYYSVNELKKVGISFVPNNTSVFTDVNFRYTLLRGEFHIPPLNIEDSTKSLLLNLAAYETCAGLYSAKCTSYVCFLGSLIDKPEDVEELRWMGILHTTIAPDDQIVKIFKEMTTNLVPNPSAYRVIKKSIESHYRSPFKRFIFHYKGRISELVVKYSFIYGIAASAIQAYLAETKQRPDYGICSCSNATLLHH